MKNAAAVTPKTASVGKAFGEFARRCSHKRSNVELDADDIVIL